MASPRSRTDVPANPSAQKRRIAASSATPSSNSRGRGNSDPSGLHHIEANAIKHRRRLASGSRYRSGAETEERRWRDLRTYRSRHEMPWLPRRALAFDTQPFVVGPPLAQRRVAIVSSAALIRRGDKPFPSAVLSAVSFRLPCRRRHPDEPCLDQLRSRRVPARSERRLPDRPAARAGGRGRDRRRGRDPFHRHGIDRSRWA